MSERRSDRDPGHASALGAVAARVAASPDRPALRFKENGLWRSLTWRDWHLASRRIAAGLLERFGLARGDRVAILAESSVAWALVDLAITTAGAVSAPIFAATPPAAARAILADCGATIAVVDDVRAAARLLDAIAGEDLPRLRGLVLVDGAGAERVAGAGPRGVVALDAIQALGASAEARLAPELAAIAGALGPDDDFTWVYTSGTTGEPKGVVLTHANLLYECWALRHAMGGRPTDEQLLILPLAQIFARHLLWGAIEHGAVTAFGSAATLEEDLVAIAPTYFAAVPRIQSAPTTRSRPICARRGPAAERLRLVQLQVGVEAAELRRRGRMIPAGLAARLRIAERTVLGPVRRRVGGRLRFCISGGAPLSPEIAAFFDALGILILEGYGLTEACGATHVGRPDRYRFGTVGPALPGTDTRIEDDGEILVRGPGVMRGYHGRPEATAAVIDEEGWLHTGDLGVVEDGFLRITGRKKDLLITSSGKTLAPLRLEERLQGAPGIAQAIVFGDRRPFVVALIVVDLPAMMAISEREGLGCRSADDLARSPRIRQIVQGHVDAINDALAPHERVRRFALLPALSAADGEVTPTQKVRRQVVEARHRDLLDSLYVGHPGPPDPAE
ncbi:MAG: AMP-dependent synthetase/ligase [Nannocystaceae bacterium]